MASTALSVPGWRSSLLELWESPRGKKARRVAFHVARGAKKFLLGVGNASWVVGTSMLVMVMPLVFEIDREENLGPQGLPLEFAEKR